MYIHLLQEGKMNDKALTTRKMKVFPKGQVIIPVELRRKYNINIGDRIEFSIMQDGILIKPSRDKADDSSLTDKLYGMFSGYARGKAVPNKKTINAATESGFVEGWSNDTTS
jgi:AbrB family looped-hinge helix DNA binding protein